MSELKEMVVPTKVRLSRLSEISRQFAPRKREEVAVSSAAGQSECHHRVLRAILPVDGQQGRFNNKPKLLAREAQDLLTRTFSEDFER
jgi:hypothetical protein